MDNFLAWLQLAWSWFWYQIGGWIGLLTFVGGTALLSVSFAHMFKRVHDWRLRRRFGAYAPLIDQFQYEPVREAGAGVQWRHATAGERRFYWNLDARGQAAQVAANRWARYSESEEER